MSIFKDLLEEYELLAAKADSAFSEMMGDYGSLITCDIHCSDCCHSVFGLFLIESVYINAQFEKLDRKYRRESLLRIDRADRELQEVEKKLGALSDPVEQARAMAGERVRCPLLDEKGKCILYSYRPVTCRVYGIPTMINGRVHACWKTRFEGGKPYPAFDLDGMYRELYGLSRRILERAGQKNMDRAALLVSLSKSINTPVEKLIHQI